MLPTPVQLPPPPPSRVIALRNAFITGLFMIAPLGVSVYVVNFLLANIGNPASNIFFGWLKNDLPNSGLADYVMDVVSTLIVLVLITALGYLSKYFFGRWLLGHAEQLILRVPIVGLVYRTTKQIVDTFHGEKKAAFQKVVMIEFPRPGLYSVGFVTSEAAGEISRHAGENYVNVFIPTTPLPTNGFFVVCHAKDLIELDMSVGDALKLIISGGAVTPPSPINLK